MVIKNQTPPTEVPIKFDDWPRSPYFVSGETLGEVMDSFHQPEDYSNDDGVTEVMTRYERQCEYVHGDDDTLDELFVRCEQVRGECSCQANQIGIAAAAPELDGIVDAFIARQPARAADNVTTLMRKFSSPAEAEAYIRNDDYGYDTSLLPLGGVIYINSGAPDWDVTIRTNLTEGRERSYVMPSTKTATDVFVKGPNEGAGDSYDSFLDQYVESGFLLLQATVFDFIGSYDGADEQGLKKYTRFFSFPSPAYTNVGFWALIGSSGNIFGIFMMCALVYPFAQVVRLLVSEKETKIKEGMKMMALSDSAFYGSWVTCFVIIDAVTSGILVIVSTQLGFEKLFDFSGVLYVFSLYFFFMLASTSFAFAIAAVFSRAKTAAVLSSIIYICGYVIYEVVHPNRISADLKSLACLHPVTCFTLASLSISEFESGSIGITSDTYRATETNNFSFGHSMDMLIVDAVFWFFLAWYLDQVAPREWGTPRPPHFLLTPQYWRDMLSDLCGIRASPQDSTEDDAAPICLDTVETVPQAQAQELAGGRGVRIRGLRKVFQTNAGEKVAVDNLDLDIYENQITALLGHNGAGKTTTIAMLTGLLPATEGRARIYGKDISTSMSEIRKSLGVCPQHDILFPELTVREHLALFGTFKGVAASVLRGEIERMIAMVGLVEKADSKAKELSGGMKRKLSVGIAFIGGSKVVFLDEPTSGMDPYSRRFTWNVIRNNREGKVIVLTTHFMDEADLLGDRIAIMAEGQLRCCGSSLFLKNLYGVGYQLSIEKGANFNAPSVSGMVTKELPNAELLSDVGTELAFQVPFEDSHKFSTLFRTFDEEQAALGVESYGMSVTTLEEVFLRVAKGSSHDSEHRSSLAPGGSREDDARPRADPESLQGSASGREGGEIVIDRSNAFAYFLLHMRALLIKRTIVFKRDYKAWLCQYMIPIVFIACGFGALTALQATYDDPLLILDTSKYNTDVHSAPRNPVMYSTPNTQYIFEGSDYVAHQFCYDNFDRSCDASSGYADGEPYMQRIPGINPYADFNGTAYDGDDSRGFGEQLLNNRNNYEASSYGAIGWSSAGNFSVEGRSAAFYAYEVFVNYTAAHAAPIFEALAQSAILEEVLGSTVTYNNHPMPQTKKQETVAGEVNSFAAVMIVLLSIPSIPAGFITFPVRETAGKAKHQQIVSGVSYPAYWLSHWIFDGASYLPAGLSIFGLLAAFNIETLYAGEGGAAILTLLLLYGFAISGFTYMMSFAFKNASTAQVMTILFNFITGFMLVIASFIMSIIPATKKINRSLMFLYRLFPTFCLGHGLLFVGLKKVLKATGLSQTIDVWGDDFAKWDVVFLAIEAVAYAWGAIGIDYALTVSSVRSLLFGTKIREEVVLELEEDVLTENERVRSGGADGDLVVIRDVKHKYPGGKVAVKGLSLGIPNGQCFGLLGINGAGKSTTLGILSGEFPPSQGTANLDGHDILRDPHAVKRLIGFCPQFDALFELLTGREHLALYARIKGVPESLINEVVEKKAAEMDLLQHYKRTAGRYSGGNKRKLSVACAMIGEPRIVFLDEPSTGMDPVARRFMWDVISKIATRDGKCAVILTTHSMEECEALCSRIGIMVGGRFRCLGSAQRLKNKFGLGYQLEMLVKLPDAAEVEAAAALMESTVDASFVDSTSIASALAAVEQGGLMAQISSSGSGSKIYQTLQSGEVPIRDVAVYACLEKRLVGVQESLEETLPGLVLKEAQGAKLRFELAGEDARGARRKLADLFDTMESAKERYSLQEYSLSQTSLEAIFNSFASQQEEEQGAAAGIVAANRV